MGIRVIGTGLPMEPAYLTADYGPTPYKGGTIQRQAPLGADGAHAGEYRVTAPDGSDLGWAVNLASAMLAIDKR